MVIYGVSFDMVGKQPIVLLKTVESNKFLPIWIGHPEAAAILMKLQGASTPRPMTHDLLSEMLGELEVECTRVAGHRAAGEHLLRLDQPSRRRPRPGDRLPPQRCARARRRSGAPIFAADEVIAESAIEFEHEVEDTEEVVEKFKDFLDQVTPETSPPTSSAGRGARAQPWSGLSAPAPRRRSRSTNPSKEIPAASAAWGSRLVSVRPGIGLTSST